MGDSWAQGAGGRTPETPDRQRNSGDILRCL